jgi:hypothetical protein
MRTPLQLICKCGALREINPVARLRRFVAAAKLYAARFSA